MEEVCQNSPEFQNVLVNIITLSLNPQHEELLKDKLWFRRSLYLDMQKLPKILSFSSNLLVTILKLW